jgi:hypothetical protein
MERRTEMNDEKKGGGGETTGRKGSMVLPSFFFFSNGKKQIGNPKKRERVKRKERKENLGFHSQSFRFIFSLVGIEEEEGGGEVK